MNIFFLWLRFRFRERLIVITDYWIVSNLCQRAFLKMSRNCRNKLLEHLKKNSLSKKPYLCEFDKFINGWKKIEINSFVKFM